MAIGTDALMDLYQPLPPGRHIRVLNLDDPENNTDSKRRYRLAPTCLDSVTPYFTLSYRWQTEGPLEPIRISGRPVMVMETVKRFLDLHWSSQPNSAIFIDSICINQSDLDERAAQVRLMGEVYANATATCIWLGDDFLTEEAWIIEEVAAKRPLLSASLDRCTNLADRMLGRDYWTRAWVMQEVILARKIQAFWGSTVMSEDTLRRLGLYSSPESWNRMSRAATALLQRETEHRQPPRSLAALLDDYGYTQARDTRDKVYALLGLVQDRGEVDAFPADYSETRTLVDVFCDALDFCNVQAVDSLGFSQRLAGALGLESQDIRGSVRASRYFIHAKSWMVSVVRDEGRPAENADLESFEYNVQGLDGQLHKMAGNERQGFRRAQAPDDRSSKENAKAADEDEGSRVADTPATLFSLRADIAPFGDVVQVFGSLPKQSGRCTRHTIESMRHRDSAFADLSRSHITGQPVARIYYTATPSSNAAKQGQVLSTAALQPGDIICRFWGRMSLLALRLARGVYRAVAKVHLCNEHFTEEHLWPFPERLLGDREEEMTKGLEVYEEVALRMNLAAVMELCLGVHDA